MKQKKTWVRSCQLMVGFLFSVLLLYACGGADTPYTIGGGTTSGGTTANLNPTAGGSGSAGSSSGSGSGTGTDLGGCVVNFDSTLTLQAQANVGTGLAISNPQPIPAIPLHFSFDSGQGTVILSSLDFPTATLSIKSIPLTVNQTSGTQAVGTYDASTGAISIPNIDFTIDGLGKHFDLQGITLTSDSYTQTGDYGPLTVTGLPLDSNTKKLKLVGGIQLGDELGLPDFKNAALTVEFDGTVDTIPDPATCVGGSAPSGVVFKEMVSDGQTTTEADLSAGKTLSFGSVFVPEAGKDNPVSSDVKFYKTKTLRVKNLSEATVTGTVASTSEFTITPTGSVSIAKGAQKDFQVVFHMPIESDYSAANVPATQTISTSLTFGTDQVSLAGIAKRAGPELVLVGAETNDPNKVDMGTVLVKVSGAQKMVCLPPAGYTVTLNRPMSIENQGIRPLQIQSYPSVLNTDSDTLADPGCSGWFGKEFFTSAPSVKGSATCQAGKCTIPVGTGNAVDFHLYYKPMNANTLTGGIKDTGTATFSYCADDTCSTTTTLTLDLDAAVSEDTSDLLKLRKQGSSCTSCDVSNGGNVNLNINAIGDPPLDLALELVNSSDKTMSNVKVTLTGTDASYFKVCGVNFGNSCSNAYPVAIPDITATQGQTLGLSAFGVRYDPAVAGTFPVVMTVEYTPQGSNVPNYFAVNLTGTVGLKPLSGDVKMRVDFISTFINSGVVNTPTNSLDYRNISDNSDRKFLKSGDFFFKITPQDPNDLTNPIKNLEIQPNPNIPAIQPGQDEIAWLKSLTPQQRQKMVRLYSSRVSTCGDYDGNPNNPTTSGDDCPTDNVPICKELPQDLDSVNWESGDPDGYCSFFYYIITPAPGTVGTYNSETGEMIVPNLTFITLNPSHRNFLSYPSGNLTNTPFEATLTTLTINKKQIPGGATLVPQPGVGSVGIPAQTINNAANNFLPCPDPDGNGPGQWDPDDPTQKPELMCYISRTSSNSDGYVKGLSVRPSSKEAGKYSVVLVTVSKYSSNGGSPEYTPFFMVGGDTQIAIQGTLEQCPAAGCN